MADRDFLDGDAVLFEFVALGPITRVAAVDPVTGTEIWIGVPTGTRERDACRLALMKLRARIAGARPASSPSTDGIIV
ncbi:MAG: hypothetical protein ACFB6S_13140 [Geminicoccaceae bacterium]